MAGIILWAGIVAVTAVWAEWPKLRTRQQQHAQDRADLARIRHAQKRVLP